MIQATSNNQIQVTTGAARGVERVGASDGRQRAGATAGGREDEVQLSGLASQIAALQPDSSSRLGKVDALREAVAGGSYQVDAAALSRQIVQEAAGEA